MAVRRQAKIWNNTLLLSIRNKSSEILIQMKIFSLKEMSLKCRLQNGCHFHSTSICLCLGWRYVMERFSSALRVLERGIPNSLFPALLVHGERKPHAIYRFSFQRANFADRFFLFHLFVSFFLLVWKISWQHSRACSGFRRHEALVTSLWWWKYYWYPFLSFLRLIHCQIHCQTWKIGTAVSQWHLFLNKTVWKL